MTQERTTTVELAQVLATVAGYLESRPGASLMTPSATGNLGDRYEVSISFDGRDDRITADEPASIGGGDAAPTPVDIALGALASCLAVGYRIWSEKLGIPIDDVEVRVRSEYDPRRLFGVDSVRPAGPDGIHVEVLVTGPTPERHEELRRAVEAASPVLDLFTAGRPISTTLG